MLVAALCEDTLSVVDMGSGQELCRFTSNKVKLQAVATAWIPSGQLGFENESMIVAAGRCSSEL